MSDCIFCKIIKNEIPSIKIYEDETVIVMMDIFPESNGHCLIIPKQHSENLFETDEDTLRHIMEVSKKLAIAVKSSLNADGIKIVQFNGADAGQTVFHYHMHMIPAYKNTEFIKHNSEPANIETLQQIANKIILEIKKG